MFLAKANSPWLLISVPPLHIESPSLICPDESSRRDNCMAATEAPSLLRMQWYRACVVVHLSQGVLLDTFRKPGYCCLGWLSFLAQVGESPPLCHPVPKPRRSAQSDSEARRLPSKAQIKGSHPMMACAERQNCQFVSSCAGVMGPLGVILKEMCTHCSAELQRKLLLRGAVLAAT